MGGMGSKFVSKALWVNLALLCVALAVPPAANSTEAAAVFFAVPMALILVVGAAVAIRAYILARRENRRPRWTAFLPLAIFLLGIGGTVVLVYTDSAWTKAPVEVNPGKR
jgi:cytochrome bd-type quinol oxidase subunit 2